MSVEALHEHRRLWERKPELAAVYRPWFERMLDAMPEGARVLEVGAGPGFLAAFARRARPDLRWIASDVVAVPWNDLCADADRLPFAAAGFDVVAALDTLHHLARPARFFAEAARVLRSEGRLVALEPWVSPLSWPVYRFLHQEGCDLGLDPWQPFAGVADKQPFDGDAAVAYKLVTRTAAPTWNELGLHTPRVARLNGFAYLPSLGFRERSLLPASLAPWLNALDAALEPLGRLTAFRAALEWRRLAGG